MFKKVIKFDDTENNSPNKIATEKKSPISIDNIDISKAVVSNKISFGKKGFKYFIGSNISSNTSLAYSFQK